jgi:hypothetical protein
LLSGTWTSFDEGLEALPLASIAFKDGELTLATKHGAAYKAKERKNEKDMHTMTRATRNGEPDSTDGPAQRLGLYASGY